MKVQDFPGGIAAIAVILVVMALMDYLIYWQAMTLSNAKATMNAVQNSIAQADAREQELKTIKANFPVIKQRYDAINALMPAEPDEEGVFATINYYSGICGLEAGTEFNPVTPGNGYTNIPFKTTLYGRYEGMMEFLSQLNFAARAIRVEDIKITTDDENLPNLKGEFNATAFCRGAVSEPAFEQTNSATTGAAVPAASPPAGVPTAATPQNQ